MREREERKKNLIKRVEVNDSKRREAVEKVLKVIGVRADMKEVKKLGKEEKKGGEILLVKLKGKKQKREIIRKKRESRDRKGGKRWFSGTWRA